ncbi:MAG: hypothetical protein AUH78_21180 [Gemmatimonadetes bacterium 13_1_40CM_4_69_8]|nr:MAG: hypothetical protein AUH46_06690 [Gemmatimonadetes bacterium 13_1_40CM_70_15]OLC70420.1 MAG: hypothetical protein AUH78_21180 [Gemmatimonadetes bacterium 13_1_40CM_4_69_8]PYP74609.1 MAG: hypothetical protein DMD41_00885 [Gemmatimonadota bacterium]
MRFRPLSLALVLLGPASLAAQGKPITVQGVRSLTFGAVLPGVPRVISRTDPVNSGQYDITGANNNQVQLSFTLPNVMNGPAGATMPIVFGGNDAGYSQSQAIGSQVAFDPKQSFLATLNKNGRGSVFVGATARPTPTQRAGSYTATLTLTVAYFP